MMRIQTRNAATGALSRLAVVSMLAILAPPAVACRSMAKVPLEAQARGTVAGTVRGPGGVAPAAGRLVELVEVESGHRESTETNDVGNYSLLVPPGRYRVEVALGPGEAVVSEPGLIDVAPSGLVSDADVVLGGAGIADPE